MFLRIDRLQVEMPLPKEPDPVAAAAVQELMGGRFGEHAPHPLEQRGALAGEQDASRGALEHRHAEPGFELADLRRKGRLRHAAPLRRPAEMPALRDRDQVLKIPQGQAGEGQNGAPHCTLSR